MKMDDNMTRPRLEDLQNIVNQYFKSNPPRLFNLLLETNT